ncbi:MAG TPA: hypothetical protein QF446_15415 [Planctomycetota bacterium]|nr:hypothetical protein [Planctomycetota bacterium]
MTVQKSPFGVSVCSNPRAFTAGLRRTWGPIRVVALGLVLARGALGAAPQDGLTNLLDTTDPGTGAFSALSADGSQLFQVVGSAVAEIDLAHVRQIMGDLGGAPADAWDLVATSVHEIDASPFSVRDLGSVLFVAGGDMGLFFIDRAAANPTAVKLDDGQGRWCFDIEISTDQLYLLAVWGGRDVTELRVYRTGSGALLRTISFDTSRLARPGIGYALELHTDNRQNEYAYLAMGRSGIARVNWRATAALVEQGYDPGLACTSTYCNDVNRVRDIAIAGDKLFAAADQAGLVEVDLLNAPLAGRVVYVPSLTCPSSEVTFAGFPTRVAALLDPGAVSGEDRIVVAVGVATKPSVAREWGPYYRYTSFTPDLTNPFPDGGFSNLCESFTEVQILEPDAPFGGVQLSQRILGDPPHHSAHGNMKSLELQVVNGTYWMFSNEFIAWSFERDPNGALANLTSSPGGLFAARQQSYSGVTVSLRDPTLVLASSDGGGEANLHRVSAPFDTLAVIPGTDDPGPGEGFYRFAMGICLDAQWRQPLSGYEWVVSGGWRLSRFRASAAQPDLFRNTWCPFDLAFPPDPICTEIIGRHYTTMGVDPDNDGGWLLLARSQIQRGLTFYWRDSIHAEADAMPLLRYDGVTELLTQPEGVVDLHDEYSSCVNDPESPIRQMQTFAIEVFQWETGTALRKVAAICAGKHVIDNRPRIVFVDLSDCADPSDACGAFFDAASQKPRDPSKVDVVHLGPYSGLAFALDVAVIANRQYAFVADTSGRLTALELKGLFSSVSDPVVCDIWRNPRSVLDQQYDIMTDVVVNFESPIGGGHAVPYAYVAADRAGLLRFEIQVAPGSGDISFAKPTVFNTPGQAAKVSIRDVAPSPQEVLRLFVSDHNDSGIRMYGN